MSIDREDSEELAEELLGCLEMVTKDNYTLDRCRLSDLKRRELTKRRDEALARSLFLTRLILRNARGG